MYCVGLIGNMVPSFVRDWEIGLGRFVDSNPHYDEFNNLGRPVFAGWVFNGFDTARRRRTKEAIAEDEPLGEREMVQADKTMHERVVEAVREDLVDRLRQKIQNFVPVAPSLPEDYRIGDIEDANVLVQNSLWLSVPLARLGAHRQVASLQDRTQWAPNQREQIDLIGQKFNELATNVAALCT